MMCFIHPLLYNPPSIRPPHPAISLLFSAGLPNPKSGSKELETFSLPKGLIQFQPPPPNSLPRNGSRLGYQRWSFANSDRIYTTMRGESIQISADCDLRDDSHRCIARMQNAHRSCLANLPARPLEDHSTSRSESYAFPLYSYEGTRYPLRLRTLPFPFSFSFDLKTSTTPSPSLNERTTLQRRCGGPNVNPANHPCAC